MNWPGVNMSDMSSGLVQQQRLRASVPALNGAQSKIEGKRSPATGREN
jgi:hypothetical protein